MNIKNSLLVCLLLAINLSGCGGSDTDSKWMGESTLDPNTPSENDQEGNGAPLKPFGLLLDLVFDSDISLITDTRPVFSWIVNDSRAGAVQTAYQIKLFSVVSGGSVVDIVWDSGKVSSSQQLYIPYLGPELEPDGEYLWMVKTWDSDDKSGEYSEPHRFKVSANASRDWPSESNWHSIQYRDGSVWRAENRNRMEVSLRSPINQAVNTSGNRYFDFGKAAFGTLIVKNSGQFYGPIEIHLGEKSDGKNIVDKNPGGSIRYRLINLTIEAEKEIYELKIPPDLRNTGDRAIHMPEFIGEVMPFRYVEIGGQEELIEAIEVTQKAVSYHFNENNSSFVSSDQVLNDVWEFSKYSIKATSFLGVYVDGDRERIPYEADAYINQLGHYATDREFAMARYTHEYLLFHANWPTEWILHSIFMAWADFMYTSDMDSLHKYYFTLQHKALTNLARDDGLISTRTGLVTNSLLDNIYFPLKFKSYFGDIVDWPESERDGFEFGEINSVVNAFYYRGLVLMSKIAKETGNSKDEEIYKDMSEKVKLSYNRVFFDSSTGLYVDGEDLVHSSFHSNLFALAFGLVEEKNISSVVEFIKSKRMAGSVYAAQYLLEALYDNDQGESALSLITDESTNRSWPHMFNVVGTTIALEAWDISYKPNLDWNHAWGAAPANIIPRKICGVEPILSGFRLIRIKPNTSGLAYAHCIVPTIRGSVGISWEDSGRIWSVNVPPNSTAEFHLPHNLEGKAIYSLSGLGLDRKSEGIYILKSGVHNIELLN